MKKIAILGDDLVAACTAWVAVQKGHDCLWSLALGEAPDEDGPHVISPMLPAMLAMRRRTHWQLPRRLSLTMPNWSGIWRRRRQLPFLFSSALVRHTPAVHQNELVAAALVSRSMKIYSQGESAPPPPFEARPAVIMETLQARRSGSRLPELAERLGIALSTENIERIGGDAEFYLLPDAWYLPSNSSLKNWIVKDYLRRGGRIIDEAPKGVEARAGGWSLARTGYSEDFEHVIVTSLDLLRSLFGKAADQVMLGETSACRQNFARLGPIPYPVCNTDGTLLVAESPRGALVRTPQHLLPESADSALASLRKLADRFPEMLGAPRDLPVAHSRQSTPDMLPMIGALAGRTGLSISMGFGEMGAAMAPAAAELLLTQIKGHSVARFEQVFSPRRFRTTKSPLGHFGSRPEKNAKATGKPTSELVREIWTAGISGFSA